MNKTTTSGYRLLDRFFILLLAHTVGITATMFWMALVYKHFGLLAPIGFQATTWIYAMPVLVIGSATTAWSAYEGKKDTQ